MKNHYSTVIGLVSALSKDIAVTFPTMQRMARIFEEKTLANLETHGLQFATILLPSLGKWFDSCLDAGAILPQRPLHHGRRGSSIYPTFLYGLWELIFDEHGVLREHPDPTAVAFLREVYYFAKKLDLDCEKERVYESVENFEILEASMARPRPDTWDADLPTWVPLSGHPIWGVREVDRHQPLLIPDQVGDMPSIPWEKFRALCRAAISSFGDINIWDLVPKHGPGAVSDSQYGIKYDLAIWPKKLNYVFPSDWFASHDFVDRSISDEEPSSMMHAVPKTQKGPRLIAAEPTAHQWAQGSLLRWLEKAVMASPLSISIDYRDQQYSGNLALESSSSREFATIDLSEASDRISCRLVEYVFQSHLTLLDCLHACRTRSIRIPASLRRDRTENLVLLRKFSTMGSAVTFPIQTIIFTLISHFAIMMKDNDWDVSQKGMRRRAPSIRVFGDDIIVRNDCYELMTVLLAECGLKVNSGKSFTQGFFREACGMDAFKGYDVTPAYLRKPYMPNKPESLGSIVEASNNFHKRGFWHAADYLLRTVPDDERKLIVRGHQALWSLTLYTFMQGNTLSRHPSRWSRRFHRYMALTLQLSSRDKDKRQGKGEASLLQFFVEDPTHLDLSNWKSGQAERPTNKKQRRWVDRVTGQEEET